MIGMGVTLAYGGFKLRQVGRVEVLVGDYRVKLVAQRLRPAMHGIVLRRRNGLEIHRVLALNAFDKRDANRPDRYGSSP
jgi:hypothetical protein